MGQRHSDIKLSAADKLNPRYIEATNIMNACLNGNMYVEEKDYIYWKVLRINLTDPVGNIVVQCVDEILKERMFENLR